MKKKKKKKTIPLYRIQNFSSQINNDIKTSTIHRIICDKYQRQQTHKTS